MCVSYTYLRSSYQEMNWTVQEDDWKVTDVHTTRADSMTSLLAGTVNHGVCGGRGMSDAHV